MQHRKIAFVGAGNMSRAIISGLIGQGYPADQIIASNPTTAKLAALEQDFGIATTQDNSIAVSFADAVVLAVKPQIMEQMCQSLSQQADLRNKLFISIAAGIPHQRLLEMLGGEYPLVRTMPNTPSALGKGMTGLYAPSTVKQDDKHFCEWVMRQVGETVWVEQEQMIDAVRAAAGSSPAYFFLFLEAMQAEAEHMGFDSATARKLVQQAMLGAAEMVCHNPHLELSELRAQVTSKGGTTAKAIECFQNRGLESMVSEAMGAAVARAKEMSNQF